MSNNSSTEATKPPSQGAKSQEGELKKLRAFKDAVHRLLDDQLEIGNTHISIKSIARLL